VNNEKSAVPAARRLPKWLSLEVLLVVIVIAVQARVVFALPNNLMYWYSTDDAFYYFKVAQNIAEGYGSTFDRMTLTNGYHPLWLLVCVPIFALARYDLMLPLRLVAGLMILLSAATGWALFRLLRRGVSRPAAWLAALFWVTSPHVHEATVEQGMEAGISALFLVLLLDRLAQIELGEDGRRSYLWAGLLAILALFSRLDNAFVICAAGGWLVLRRWWAAWRQTGRLWPERALWLRAAAYFAPLGVALLLYMAWNAYTFGTPTPVSGQIKRWWGTLDNTVYGYPIDSLASFVGHWFSQKTNVGPWSLAIAPIHWLARQVELLMGIVSTKGEAYKLLHRNYVLGVTLALLPLLGALVWRNWRGARRAAVTFSLLPLFVGCALQITSYFSTHYISMHDWYWVGEMICITLALGILLDGQRHLPAWRRALVGLAAGAVSVALVYNLYSTVQTLVPVAPEIGYEDGYLWGARGLEELTPPGAMIGTPGGGAVAYFIQDRTIVNLDGLMNSYEYFQEMQAGKAGAYLDRLGLRYAYGNQYMLSESDPYWQAFKGRLRFVKKVVGTDFFQVLPPPQ